MTTTSRRLLVAALLLLAAVVCNGDDGEFYDTFTTFPQGPLPTSAGGGAGGFAVPGWAGAGGFGFPGWGGGNWMPSFPDAGHGGRWGGNMGGGWGGGSFGGAGGGGFGGMMRPSVVCSERGPCFRKRVTCPAKCFTSYSRHGKNFAGGGGGGGCTIDCKKRCIAYC